ncbi:hypothetical protein UJ101_00615 [Flavobacteriaceae bacterium UJ101]|nr:hypothetical protein UJ101_00615 [Flavobacteriaceae bacterium UJ101]
MKKIIAFFSLVGMFLTNSCSQKTEQVVEHIQNPNVTLIDVREAEELVNDGKIDQAVHIPKGDISNHIEEIKSMSKPVVVFCRSGVRAQGVVDYLQEKGIEEVYNGGGMKNVKEALKK